MTKALRALLRRFRRGRPIVVVSGLPRSGTSMMMRMLESGGMEVVGDNVRKSDEDNPRGYFEFERVKNLDKDGDKSWLREARGKTIKVISYLLKNLPKEFEYKIVLLRRNLDEVLASQQRMLEQRNKTSETSDEDMKAAYEKHLKDVASLLGSRKDFDCIEVQYDRVIQDPREYASKVNDFLGGGLDVAAMAAAVDKDLYRNRKVADDHGQKSGTS